MKHRGEQRHGRQRALGKSSGHPCPLVLSPLPPYSTTPTSPFGWAARAGGQGGEGNVAPHHLRRAHVCIPGRMQRGLLLSLLPPPHLLTLPTTECWLESLFWCMSHFWFSSDSADMMPTCPSASLCPQGSN